MHMTEIWYDRHAWFVLKYIFGFLKYFLQDFAPSVRCSIESQSSNLTDKKKAHKKSKKRTENSKQWDDAIVEFAKYLG